MIFCTVEFFIRYSKPLHECSTDLEQAFDGVDLFLVRDKQQYMIVFFDHGVVVRNDDIVFAHDGAD